MALFTGFIVSQDKVSTGVPENTPLPISMRDMDASVNASISMELPMADACPSCGGFHWQSGDYMCWGHCFECEKEANQSCLV